MTRRSEPYHQAGAGLPAVFGKHVLLAKLATGGMGEVFLARMRGAAGFEKLLVLKRLLPHLGEQARFVSMFLDEARLAARISHSNVCQIYELGEVDGQYYITMEYLEGAQLSQVIERRRLDPRLADLCLIAGVLSQVSEGLHSAHDLRNEDRTLVGVVHRDVCLSNIFVTWSGIAKVLDFGVAKARGALSKTRPGAVKGTYAYMSPEQLRGEDVAPCSDVFALGVVAWEAITGRRLFKRKTDFQTFKAITEEPIPLASDMRSDVPPALARAVQRALERDPERRYQSAREFGAAIVHGVESLGPPMLTLAIANIMRESFNADIDRHRARIAAIYRGSAGEEERDYDTSVTEEMPISGRRRLETDVDEDAQRATHPVIRMPLPAPSTATGTGQIVRQELLKEAFSGDEVSVDEELKTVSLAGPGLAGREESADEDADDFEGLEEDTSSEDLENSTEELGPSMGEPPPEDDDTEPATGRRRTLVPVLLTGIVATVAVIAYTLARDRGRAEAPAARQGAPVASAPSQPSDQLSAPPPVEARPVAPVAAAPADAGMPPAVAQPQPPPPPPPPPPTDAGPSRAAPQRTPPPPPKPAAVKRAKPNKRVAKRTADEPPTHAKPREPGFLTIDSTPYATVFLDGKKLGYTPIVDLEVPAGTHKLRAVSSVDSRERTLTVTVKPRKHLRRKVKW